MWSYDLDLRSIRLTVVKVVVSIQAAIIATSNTPLNIIIYYYVQRCITSSNNSNLDTKSHLSTEIVL